MYKLAIVGRPNVGKSALFNRICRERISIVDEAEGITRDRIYSHAEIFGSPFEVIDTGGIGVPGEYVEKIRRQAEIAIQEADTLVMVVDGKVAPTAVDLQLARLLLKTGKPLTLAVNKVDEPSQLDYVHAYYELGISKIIGVSAAQGYQIAELLELAWEGFQLKKEEEEPKRIRVAIVGRPNVGKSTLLNTVLHEERCLVSSTPGTTRDSVDVHYDRFTLIDTAGIRRKKSEHEVVDKFAAIRTERAIERANVCLLMLDVQEGLTSQEKRIIKQIEKAGKSCIVLMNKWDLVKDFRMEHCIQAFQKESPFLKHCPLLLISAKTGRNLDKIFDEVEKVYQASCQRITTHQLNKFVERAIQLNHPPMITGKRLRIYYMTQVETQPPKFILFVNYTNLMSDTYKKYLINQFRQHFHYVGTPLELHLKAKKQTSSKR